MAKKRIRKRISFRSILNIIKLTIQGFTNDGVTKLSASLAYATIFALVPFLTFMVTFGTWFDQDISSQVYGTMDELVGSEVTAQLRDIIRNTSDADSSTLARLISLGVMIFGATAIFAEMQTSLNTIWGIKPKPKKGWLHYVRNRVLSFSIILILGFLLLITLSVSTLINSLRQQLIAYFPDITAILFQVIGMVLNILVVSSLFILIFKILPDAKIKFKDVMVGGIVTTIFFLIGQFAISVYLGTRNTLSVYGAAAFLIILLSWIYYSSIIVYIGAEFTKAWANEIGGKIYPDQYAVSTRIVEITDDKPIEVINKTETDLSSDNKEDEPVTN
ncbi:YihY/virulence factor BrkB family protein [Proteiniphilum sp. X52]|uniref:YihY/virulence factor BrkB family protein n=1 Tax=Proteiniphilum sp. X52 TaxID=2382159 RepID=UPI000F0A2AEC|nr:YihY/virulence factor BrkB family protein [Proteiniphilum sp. X52]RNC66850.1 YihY/virulence factor BrkB family protein [Proteiniphilum sp. X52]